MRQFKDSDGRNSLSKRCATTYRNACDLLPPRE